MPTKRQSKGYTRVLSWTFVPQMVLSDPDRLLPLAMKDSGEACTSGSEQLEMFLICLDLQELDCWWRRRKNWTKMNKISRSAVQSFFETKTI